MRLNMRAIMWKMIESFMHCLLARSQTTQQETSPRATLGRGVEMSGYRTNAASLTRMQ